MKIMTKLVIFLLVVVFTIAPSTLSEAHYEINSEDKTFDAQTFINRNAPKSKVFTSSIKHIHCRAAGDHPSLPIYRISGTAFAISKDRYVTAAHVLKTTDCVILGKPATILYHSLEMDFAIVEWKGPPVKPLRFSCKGFQTGVEYFGIGYPSHTLLATKLKSTNIFIEEKDVRFKLMRRLQGDFYHGMSGGPIIDSQGVVHGINSATEYNSYGLSREIKDSPLCKKAGKSQH